MEDSARANGTISSDSRRPREWTGGSLAWKGAPALKSARALKSGKLFGEMSEACDFADLALRTYCTRPVAPLQGSFGQLLKLRPLCLGFIIHPPNSF